MEPRQNVWLRLYVADMWVCGNFPGGRRSGGMKSGPGLHLERVVHGFSLCISSAQSAGSAQMPPRRYHSESSTPTARPMMTR
jgi:hypothetical protein